MSASVRTLAACLLLAALVAAAAARPADQNSSDVMPSTTLLAQDLELMAQEGPMLPGPGPTKGQQDRPVRASPLAHIIADIIDVS